LKKLLLLLFVLPLFGISQELPLIYASIDSDETQYIDRDKRLQRDIKSLENEIKVLISTGDTTDDVLLDVYYPEVLKYYIKFGKISEEVYFKYLKLTHQISGGVYGIVPDYVSSTLSSQGNNSYDKSNLGDRDARTAWVEGADGYGIGEYIEMVIDDDAVRSFYILNGYQKSIKSWKDNSRVKSFKVYIDNIPICILELEDRMGKQGIPLGTLNDLLPEGFDIWGDALALEMRLEILEVYPGERWKDVCISGFSIYWCYC
jgi:hypothetical protein